MLHYTYGFGDDWKHLITLEAIIEEYHYGYPKIIDREGNCPSEDVSGPGEYEEFMKVYNDPDHPGYEAMRAWAKEQRYRELIRNLLIICLSK